MGFLLVVCQCILRICLPKSSINGICLRRNMRSSLFFIPKEEVVYEGLRVFGCADERTKS